MKISCQSCGAKYNIADEKVRGKIVKIACKKCGARIEIDGRDAADQVQDQDETRVFDQASAPAPGGSPDTWTVSIDDNDQREVTTAQLIDLYRQGVVTQDTFLWRDGMADWSAVRDVPDLQAQLGSAAPAAYSAPPPASPAYPSEPPTAIHPAAASPSFNGGGYSSPQIETSNAARLGGSRRGGAVDLFAAQPAAAEEEDVATSAPPGGAMAAMAAPAGGHGGAPIGARNENSVLFSLSALTASGPAQSAAPMPADEEKSGLIDIQKLAAAAKPTNGGRDDRAKLDDIMNLGGGGAFGNALGAPILAPPPAAALSEGVSGGGEEKGKSNKGLIFAMAGVVALLLAVVIVLLLRKPDETASKDKEKAGIETPTKDDKKDDKKVAAAATETAAAPGETAPDPAAGGPIGKPGGKPAAGGAATGTAKAGTTATAGGTAAATETAKPSPASKCTTLDCAMGGTAPAPTAKPAETAPAGGGEIDKSAAIAALKNVPYKDCGSGGAGKVTVTFGGTGSVQSAVVTAGEYDGGTKSCIQNRFKGAKVPAYGGAPKSFGWSISL